MTTAVVLLAGGAVVEGQVGLHTTPLFRNRQGRATDKTPY